MWHPIRELTVATDRLATVLARMYSEERVQWVNLNTITAEHAKEIEGQNQALCDVLTRLDAHVAVLQGLRKDYAALKDEVDRHLGQQRHTRKHFDKLHNIEAEEINAQNSYTTED